jgi:hypothetical protein
MALQVYIAGADEVIEVELGTSAVVSPSIISQDGGTEITITGLSIPANDDLRVYIGPNGDTTDTICYGGQGFGYLPQSSDGSTLTIVSPPLTKGTASITIVHVSTDEATVLVGVLTVVERFWSGKQFEIRQSFPRWCGVGARRLELEDLL